MVATRFSEHLLTGDHASRPAAADVPDGTLYACSTHSLIYQSDTSSWSTWATLTGSGLTDHTHAVTGSGATGGGDTLNPVTMKLPAAMGTTEGQVDWDPTFKKMSVYDTQRERGIGHVGWQPTAFPVGHSDAAFSTALNLAANGGSIAVPILVAGHMMSRGVGLLNVDSASLRTCEIRLYLQRLNNGNAGENTLDEVPGTDGTDSFTPSGPSQRGILFSTLPSYLAPGVYWLVVRNTHATNTFGIGSTAPAGSFTPSLAQTKTLGSALGTTLDFVAATWTKTQARHAVRLAGNVFGQTSSF